jgi:hypothetical protein
MRGWVLDGLVGLGGGLDWAGLSGWLSWHGVVIFVWGWGADGGWGDVESR